MDRQLHLNNAGVMVMAVKPILMRARLRGRDGARASTMKSRSGFDSIHVEIGKPGVGLSARADNRLEEGALETVPPHGRHRTSPLPSSLSDSRDRRSNLETNGIDERIFQQRNSSLLAISILLFHLSAKSDRLLAAWSCGHDPWPRHRTPRQRPPGSRPSNARSRRPERCSCGNTPRVHLMSAEIRNHGRAL